MTGVNKELVTKYRKQGISIKKIAEVTDTSITQTIEMLRGLDEVLEDQDEELDGIET